MLRYSLFKVDTELTIQKENPKTSYHDIHVAWHIENDFFSSDTMGSQPLFVTGVHRFTHKDWDIKIFISVIS